MMSTFIAVIAGFCELVFAGSIIYVRLGDPIATREFCDNHKIFRNIWAGSCLAGFVVFMIQLLC